MKKILLSLFLVTMAIPLIINVSACKNNNDSKNNNNDEKEIVLEQLKNLKKIKINPEKLIEIIKKNENDDIDLTNLNKLNQLITNDDIKSKINILIKKELSKKITNLIPEKLTELKFKIISARKRKINISGLYEKKPFIINLKINCEI